MTWLLGIAVVYCIVAPPKWDPAIRWKEYNIARAKRLQERK
jgi:rRNA maturation protein Nop10